ncbi:MAG: CusA/CzcA family heavy metal efflux RND transporter [Candidatus Binatia bacterium]|nr:CusA/CzcA family heavy metal efflux RND transporter [Candidatus Binatia bacterium]
MGVIERFVAATFRHPAGVAAAVAALIVGGLWCFRWLPVEAFPDLTNQQVVVVSEAPGMAAADVEHWITYPIEAAVMGIPGAVQVRSTSKFGLSLVTIVFEDQVPLYFARQQVNERLADVRERLPAGVTSTLGPVATPFGEVFQYLVEGPLDAMERKTLQDWEIRLRLRSVQGVSEVNSWGGFTKRFEVEVDPQGLEKYGFALSQVLHAVRANNTVFGGGFVEEGAERFTIRGRGQLTDMTELGSIVLAAHNGTPIYLRDLAQISLGALPRYGAVTRDARGETVSGMVILLKGTNAAEATERVKQRVKEIEKTLPPGTRIEPFYDQSEVIHRTSRTVARNLLEGCALVVLVLVLFLRDWRAALLVSSVIPLAMLCGFSGMYLLGVSANLMSLGAIDFGLIVDGAVVMVENLVRRRDEHRGTRMRKDLLPVYRAAAIEVARPVAFGVAIIVAVYLPIFTLEGLEGKMYRPMAITVCTAILGALLLALTAIPAAAPYVLATAPQRHEEAVWFRWLQNRYQQLLIAVMARRKLIVPSAAGVVVLALCSLPFLGTEFMPKLDEGSILVQVRLLPSVSLAESVDTFTRLERMLLEFPQVRSVVTKIGRPDIATEAMGIYEGDMYVLLKPAEQWPDHITKEELIDALAEHLEQVPGISLNFTQPMAMRLDEVISGIKADVAVKIFGPDPTELQRIGNEVRAALETVAGVADLRLELLSGARELSIAIDRMALARYGLSVDDVRDVVEAATGGVTVTEILEGARRFPVVVRLPEAYRRDAEALAQIPLLAPGGERIRLHQIARITPTDSPEAIQREDGQRRLVVQANVRGRDLGSFVAEAHHRIDETVHLPPGYHFRWGGQFENQQRAMRRLAIVVPLALGIVCMLLYATFGRLRYAALVLMGVPFGTVGGIAALWLRGLHLNLAASIGFVALFGIAVLNGVVMISAINRLREAGLALTEATVQGATQRLKPVLMTALVAAFGFLPMAVSHSSGAEVQRPLATVVIGGILSAATLTLLILPSLYEWLERRVATRWLNHGS